MEKAKRIYDMNKLYRIVDANINRASEGLRVLEDVARLYYNDKILTEKLKIIRHGIRKNSTEYLSEFFVVRDSESDVGLSVSKKLQIDDKDTISSLITANFKRIQEALRTIEETFKVLDKYELSKKYEDFRFKSYDLERDYFAIKSNFIKKNKLNSNLYCLTAEEFSDGRSNIEVVKKMISAGVKIIQYREKDKTKSQKYNECKEIRELTRQAGVTFIVNDDVDIAMTVNADGIHIGQNDFPLQEVRKLVGYEMIIGLSTCSPDQAQDAVRMGADYIGVGPIYKTFTKKDACEPVGLEYLEYVAKNIDIPFVAIGGIKEYNLQEVLARGAKSVAIVSDIVGAEDIEKKIANINKCFVKEDL